MRSGTPRVQGYPTPHKRHGRRRGQAVKAGHGPPRLRGAQRPLLPGTAAAPSPPKRDGVRAPRPCRLLGLRGDAPASRDLRAAEQAPRWPTPQHPSAGVEGAPSGGGRATHRRGLDAPAPGPAGVGGGQHHGLRAAPDQNACGDGTSRDHTHQWLLGVWLVATRSEQQATRAGQVGARHNGGRVQRGHKQSFSGSLGTRYMRQPVMLSWPSANLPRRPARLGRARCPDWPAIRCPARHAPSFDCSDAGSNHYHFNSWSCTFHEG